MAGMIAALASATPIVLPDPDPDPNPNPNPNPQPNPGSTVDQFGIKKIYSTKTSGEEWFMNSNNLLSDPRFDGSDDSVSKNVDGTYKATSSAVRLNVFTTKGYNPGTISTYNQAQLATKGYMQDSRDWKNVEMTGYVKVNSASADNFAWYARGGKHNDSNSGCEGTAYKGDLDYDGKVRFAKEQWHSGGYSFSDKAQATDSIMGEWIGFKTIMYNNAQGNVVLQIWLNENNDKVTWTKEYDMIDSGNFGSDGTHCGGSANQKITWGGPIATFRWDSASNVDFKELSIREIQPPT